MSPQHRILTSRASLSAGWLGRRAGKRMDGTGQQASLARKRCLKGARMNASLGRESTCVKKTEGIMQGFNLLVSSFLASTQVSKGFFNVGVGTPQSPCPQQQQQLSSRPRSAAWACPSRSPEPPAAQAPVRAKRGSLPGRRLPPSCTHTIAPTQVFCLVTRPPRACHHHSRHRAPPPAGSPASAGRGHSPPPPPTAPAAA